MKTLAIALCLTATTCFGASNLRQSHLMHEHRQSDLFTLSNKVDMQTLRAETNTFAIEKINERMDGAEDTIVGLRSDLEDVKKNIPAAFDDVVALRNDFEEFRQYIHQAFGVYFSQHKGSELPDFKHTPPLDYVDFGDDPAAPYAAEMNDSIDNNG